MLPAVTDFVLPALFLSSGAFALATLALTWRHYGAQFRALRTEMDRLADTREFILRMSTVEVRELAPLAGQSRVRSMDRPAPALLPKRRRPALRAAA